MKTLVSVCHLLLLVVIVMQLTGCTGSPRYTRATPASTKSNTLKKPTPSQKNVSKPPIKHEPSSVQKPLPKKPPVDQAVTPQKKEIEIQEASVPQIGVPSGPQITPPEETIKEEIRNPEFVYYQKGKASYYSDKLHGNKTASGERYNKKALTAAHPRLPFGTIVRVTNTKNHRSVIVRINDRGPFTKGRVIDVSRAAAVDIGMISSGIVEVLVEVQKKGN